MAFSFGFTDDLEDEDMANVVTAPPQTAAQVEPAHEETVPVKTHRLEDLVGTTFPIDLLCAWSLIDCSSDLSRLPVATIHPIY